jgi:hypothetical protein
VLDQPMVAVDRQVDDLLELRHRVPDRSCVGSRFGYLGGWQFESAPRRNKVPDAFLAAAMEQGATSISSDRAFAGVPGLRWMHPLGH